jgi:hypothetical protein
MFFNWNLFFKKTTIHDCYYNFETRPDLAGRSGLKLSRVDEKIG